MEHIRILNIKGDEAKRVKAEIRMRNLKRKIFMSNRPSVQWMRAYHDKYFAGQPMVDGHPIAKEIEA